MKTIKDFIAENLMNESKLNWDSKDIDEKNIIKLAKEAVKQAKVKPEDIQDELSQYKDPDDLDKAYENGDLSNYSAFENAMYKLLAADAKYKNSADSIMNYLFDRAYDLMDAI